MTSKHVEYEVNDHTQTVGTLIDDPADVEPDPSEAQGDDGSTASPRVTRRR